MTQKALVDYPTSMSVYQVNPTDFLVATPLYWVDCPDDVIAYQWTYDGTNFIPPVIDYDFLRQQVAESLYLRYTAILDIGATYMSTTWRVREEDIIFYNTLYSLALSSTDSLYTWASTAIYDTAGAETFLTADTDALAFGNAILPKYANVKSIYVKKTYEVLALLNDEAAIAAYDIDADFPSVPL